MALIQFDLPCSHRGRRIKQDVFECELHGRCTLDRVHERIRPCIGCADRSPDGSRPDTVSPIHNHGECRFRGNRLREDQCPTCSGIVLVKVFACPLHAECQLGNKLANVHSCRDCRDFEAAN